MKNKQILTAACAVMLLVPLTGCQLAKVDAAVGKTRDRLVGVYITDEYLDLFDMEGYLNDNLKGFSGGELKLKGDSDQYNGRLYATTATKEHTSAQTGQPYTTTEYTFPGTEGIHFFATEKPSENSITGTTSCVYGEGISDSHFATHHGDDEDRITLDGMVYFMPGATGQTHYVNPVYQNAQGEIYATTGQGLSVEGVKSEGGVLSQKMEDSVTFTENGKSKKKTTIINLSIATMLPPQKLVLLEMDKSSAILSRTEYTPGQLPESITPSAATDYLIMESHKTDFEGQKKIERTLFPRGSQSVNGFYATDKKVLVEEYATVNW